jgi:hypothetical protein
MTYICIVGANFKILMGTLLFLVFQSKEGLNDFLCGKEGKERRRKLVKTRYSPKITAESILT